MDEAREVLLFWQGQVGSLNGRPIWFSSGATRVAYSDASDSGYGGYVVELGRDIVQAQQSSTWRELKAFDGVLRSVADKLAGHTLKWLTDSQNVVRIIHTFMRTVYQRTLGWKLNGYLEPLMKDQTT